MGSALGEDEIIARHFAPLAGPGGLGLRDDAAMATPRPGRDLVVSKDMLVAGRHFFADDPADAVAAKALAVNLSDLAAKAAEPLGFLLGLALPDGWGADWLAAFCAGLGAEARRHGCPLLGGDTVATPGPLLLSVTVFGEVPAGRMVPRPGARAGDRLFVSGTIGDAALGLLLRLDREGDRAWAARLGAAERAALLGRYLRPQPRLQLRDALRRHARAAMDVSDGLIGDLAKMLQLEGLGAAVPLAAVPFSPAVRAAVALEPRLAVAAVTGGDDYELLCAVPADDAEGFAAAARRAGIAVAEIGVARENDGIDLVDADGRRIAVERGRFQHFT